MSMREEVKIRCSAAEKEAWQSYAAEDDVPLSEVIRNVMNALIETRAWEKQNAKIDGLSLVGNAIALTGEEFLASLGDDADLIRVGDILPAEVLDVDESEFRTILAVPPADVPTERRTETCAHGRPGFIFCGTCDA